MARPKKLIQLPEGTHDILPEDQIWWDFIFNVIQEQASYYNFGKIETPIFEFADIFIKGTGLATDIVEKQMYSFKTKGGENLTLRPEGTPPIARAYIKYGMFNLPQPVKLYYVGPFFRYERPQRGRYREFHQFGFEILGENNAVLDAQVIQIFSKILKSLGFKNPTVQVNSIGCSQCRPYFKKILKNFYKSKTSQICLNCKRRLSQNPLRVLDCKEEKCMRIRNNAPQIVDHLCEECHDHFKAVLEFLDELGIAYALNPYLVRGLDYYTKTVFEFWPEGLREDDDLPPSAVGGGGRYDDLVKLIGGRTVPAVGVAGGIERIIYEMKRRGLRPPEPPPRQVFLVQLGDLAKKKSLLLLEEFQKAKIRVAESFGRDSIKSQLNLADRLKVKYSLILGQREALEGTIILKDMEKGSQEIIALDKIVEEVKNGLRKK